MNNTYRKIRQFEEGAAAGVNNIICAPSVLAGTNDYLEQIPKSKAGRVGFATAIAGTALAMSLIIYYGSKENAIDTTRETESPLTQID